MRNGTRNINRIGWVLLSISACAVWYAQPARAEDVRLDASGQNAPASSFTLTFPEFNNFQTAANITTTEFDLQIDPDAGSAGFSWYHQNAQPLLIPTAAGDVVSTGNLVIEIVPGSSAGTFDAGTGVFDTAEQYVIYFDGDLSAFGLESPVILPSTSAGVVLESDADSGQIAMQWQGGGELIDASTGTPIEFEYTCDVSANYFVAAPCASNACDRGDVNLDCIVDLSDLQSALENFGRQGFLVARQHGDVDGDSDIDLDDLTLVLATFGADCAP